MEISFLAICKYSILGNQDVSQDVSGPYHNKFSESFTTPYLNHENVGIFKEQTYYCIKKEDGHYKVFCNDSSGSYNYILTEHLFKYYFYSKKELRKEKLKKLNNL